MMRAVDLKYAAAMGAVVAALAGLWSLAGGGPAPFGRRTFEALAQGRLSAARGAIAWEQFSAVGMDVGASYRQLAGAQDRRAYERLFVESFAKGFKQAGARARDFGRWRLYGESEAYTVVAADNAAKGKTLLLAVSKQRPQRLAAIQWQ